MLFTMIATPDAAALLGLKREPTQSMEGFSQFEIARVWLRQDTGEPIAGETLMAQQHRTQRRPAAGGTVPPGDELQPGVCDRATVMSDGGARLDRRRLLRT